MIKYQNIITQNGDKFYVIYYCSKKFTSSPDNRKSLTNKSILIQIFASSLLGPSSHEKIILFLPIPVTTKERAHIFKMHFSLNCRRSNTQSCLNPPSIFANRIIDQTTKQWAHILKFISFPFLFKTYASYVDFFSLISYRNVRISEQPSKHLCLCVCTRTHTPSIRQRKKIFLLEEKKHSMWEKIDVGSNPDLVTW